MDFLTTLVFGEFNIPLFVFGTILGLVGFATYLLATWRAGLRNGNWPYQSISITYYEAYPTNPCDLRWLFQMFMALSITCIFMICQTWFSVFFVVIPFTIMTLNPSVGEPETKADNPDMKHYYNRWFIPHMIGAFTAIISLCIHPVVCDPCVITHIGLAATVIAVLTTVLLYMKKKTLTYMVEVVSLICAIVTNVTLGICTII